MILAEKRLADGRLAEIIPLTYGRARLTVRTEWGTLWHDDEW